MTPVARSQLLSQVNIQLSAQAELMAESRPHGRAKSKTLDKLGQYFSRIGRRIYLADELAVHYPGERVFAPDIMAVLDVDDPGDADERMAWVVAEEGKGLDLVIEIHHSGDWNKDFVDNVERYGRLGISEYFIYDRKHQLLRGYRLPRPGAARYQELRSRLGKFSSQVLGLDLIVAEGRLRFFTGSAELCDSAELLNQLDQMLEDVQHRRDEDEAQRQAVALRLAAAEAQRQAAFGSMRSAVLAILAARGLPLGAAAQQAITTCEDSDALGRALLKAATASSADDLL